MSDIQTQVDRLAAALQRPVGVDNSNFRLVANSAHDEVVDTVRLAKLLMRECTSDVTEWLELHGVRSNEDYVRVPASDRLGMGARVIVPLRFDGNVVGFITLIDEPEPYSRDEIAEALRFRPEMALALFRQRQARPNENDPAMETARRLLGLTPDSEDDGELGEGDDLLTERPAYACLVAQAATAPDTPALSGIDVRLSAGVERIRQVAGSGEALALSQGDYSVGIFALISGHELDSIAKRLLDDLDGRFEAYESVRPIVAVGEPVTRLTKIRRSFEGAKAAANLATLRHGSERLIRWSDLGADGTIAKLLDDAEPAPFLPDSMRSLLDHPDAASLAVTLETYLENAADTSATAAALYVHRTSLYHRLRRIEEVAGVDLSTGDGRLEMHLGLRLLRMSSESTSGPAHLAATAS